MSPPNGPGGIQLRFPERVPAKIRARMDYAFRVFAAVYGHPVSDDEPEESGITLFYGEPEPQLCAGHRIYVPALYRPHLQGEAPLRPTAQTRGRGTMQLFYGVNKRDGQPDWLGEIFEWLSSSAEMSVTGRDALGRIPSATNLFGRWGIPPRKAHLMPVMASLEARLRGMKDENELPKAPSPIEGEQHFVVCSHDIDYYWTTRRAALQRSIKNLAIAGTLYKDWSFFRSNAASAISALFGRRIGDYLPALVSAGQRRGFDSTLFAIVKRGHRRDANYSIDDLTSHLASARREGFRVALHGSYRSIVENRDLRSEASELERAIEQLPLGNRQHWLRFDSHENLFRSVERAGLIYDSTLGFPETPGFRNGAAFAFPPYDFKNEKPFEFLEIPLVLMDGSIEAAARASGEEPRAVMEEVLSESRKWGWGGISALWHNPLEELHVPKKINDLFRECVEKKERFRERWLSAEGFMALCLRRFHDAGLLRTVRLDA